MASSSGPQHDQALHTPPIKSRLRPEDQDCCGKGREEAEGGGMTEAASGYERRDLEKYFTPAWVTDALIEVVELPTPIYDPAAGAGDIINAIHAWEHLGRAYASDIAPDAAWIDTADFLLNAHEFCRTIITNPPFGQGGRLAVKFIDRALALTKPRDGKVAMLLRVDFDSAGGRRKLFSDHPAFAAKYVLTKRIRWSNLPQSAAGPTQNHAWFVWDWTKPGSTPPLIGYLPLRSVA
jgi:hypothetical protein